MSKDFLKGYCQLYADLKEGRLPACEKERGRGNNVPASAFVERLVKRFISMKNNREFSRTFENSREFSTAFGEESKEIEAFLDGYEYTTDENCADSMALGGGASSPRYAITPEMLGRVYERLMTDNREKGAFYTPRKIVDYMCREAIVGYLCNTCRVGEEKAIRRLVEALDRDGLSPEQRQEVITSLWNIRIFDPAVGAGAFPIGMLRLLQKVYSALGGMNEPKTTRHIIENNLYGMDIDAGAIEVTKWRLMIAAGCQDIKINMRVGDTLR